MQVSRLIIVSISLSCLLIAQLAVWSPAAASDRIVAGAVRAGGQAVAGSDVTLWAAGAGEPVKLAAGKSAADGGFSLSYNPGSAKDGSLYIIASAGQPGLASEVNPAIRFLSVLGPTPPESAVVNEMTTIASVVTHGQFIKGEVIKGAPLSLRIAAANVPNFIDLATGGYGDAIQDPLNSSQTPTMANLATLGNLLAGCATAVRGDACDALFAAVAAPDGSRPADTLSVVEFVQRNPAFNPEKLFALLDRFYPVPAGKQLRPTPYLPYLTFSPSAWIFPLKFAGGGYSGGGKLMFDSQGNVWVGNNFLVGAQNQSILWSGNVSKFAPDGRALSPMTTGFTGGGVVGVGFGLAVDAKDNAWVDSYAGQAIAVFDPAGKPLSPSNGYNFEGKLGEMQGIIVAPNGDIWAVDQGRSQLVHLPGGDPAKGEILCQNESKDPLRNPCGLFAPFHLAIDAQDRLWITNNIGKDVIRISASDPTKVDKFEAGYGGSGLAIDSLGNVWVANRFGSSDRGRLKLYELMAAYALKGEKDATEILVRNLSAQTPGFKEGGSVSVLKPDGSQAQISPVYGKGLAGPWAVAVDGNDNIWVSNLVSDSTGIVQLCGFRPENCPSGAKTGDAISPPGGYVGGGMQQLVDIGVGPAGDVWVTNNWDNDEAAFGLASEALSTRGAGQGVVVFYGMAKPVRTPLIGLPRALQD